MSELNMEKVKRLMSWLEHKNTYVPRGNRITDLIDDIARLFNLDTDDFGIHPIDFTDEGLTSSNQEFTVYYMFDPVMTVTIDIHYSITSIEYDLESVLEVFSQKHVDLGSME